MCEHKNFSANCKVARLEDSGRFMLEVSVQCAECRKPFQFLGLQPGLDLNGARVSLDGLELNVAICPQGVRPTPLDGFVRGYDISKGNQ